MIKPKSWVIKALILIHILIASIIISSFFSHPFVKTISTELTHLPNKRTPIENPLRASIGVNITSVENLDLSSKTFHASGYVAMKWDKVPQWVSDWDKSVSKSLVNTINFSNAVEEIDFLTSIEPELPYREKHDNEFIHWLYFSGKFIANDISFKQYPFNNITLPIKIELDDFFDHEIDLELLPVGNVVTGNTKLHGFNLVSSEAKLWETRYKTNWGSSDFFNLYGDYQSDYNGIIVNLDYQKSRGIAAIDVLFPLAVVFILSILSIFVDISHYDSKIMLPASIILVLVFLREGYKSNIPKNLEYLTIADCLFMVAFSSSALIFSYSLFVTNKYLRMTSEEKDKWRLEVRGLDKQIFYLSIIFALAVSLPILMSQFI